MALYAISDTETTGTARKTILQLRGATTTKAAVAAWGVSFDGIVGTDAPIKVDFERQSSDGTATGATEHKFDDDSATAQVTGFDTFTGTMPTSSTILETWYVHPQGGMIIREYPPGYEPVIDNATTSRIAITVTAAVAVNCAAWIHWEE